MFLNLGKGIIKAFWQLYCWRLFLSSKQQMILRSLVQGASLKAHRDMSGQKIFRLHTLSGNIQEVSARSVLSLFYKQLIYTNHKFPVNTYFLTKKGTQIAGNITFVPFSIDTA